MENRTVKYCRWRNNCRPVNDPDNYLCCNFCNNKKCDVRCTDDCDHCPFAILKQQVLARMNSSHFNIDVTKKLKRQESEEVIDANLYAEKKKARKLAKEQKLELSVQSDTLVKTNSRAGDKAELW